MFFKQIKKLLPKKLVDGVAPKTLASQHLFSKLGVTRKQTRFLHFPKVAKITFGLFLLFYFSGYQPVLAIPPFQQIVVKAEFSQAQAINSNYLSQPFQLPHLGYLSTKFSSWHPGVDLATGLGMPIHPIAKGKVVEVVQGFWGLGHSVTIEHEQGFKSIYGHMGRIFVKKDDLVEASSVLGEVGMTGHTTGPHTHLEVMKDNQYIDPQTILPSVPNWPESAGRAPSGEGEKPKKSVSLEKTKPAIFSSEYLYQSEKKTSENPQTRKLLRLLLLQEDSPASQTALFPY